ncbi:MAG: hypothetical protein ACO2O0_12065 [Desulfurococcales archaeon]|jgi:hypothetical protein
MYKIVVPIISRAGRAAAILVKKPITRARPPEEFEQTYKVKEKSWYA